VKVCQIDRVGKGENFRVVLEDGNTIILSMELIYKNSISIGVEIDEKHLSQVFIENEKAKAFDRAVKLISRVSKSKKEVKEYLFQKGYTSEVVDYAISKLEDYKYLNDELYAKDFVSCNKNLKGKRMISYMLAQKGVDKEVIQHSLLDFDEFTPALNLAEKYMKNKDYDYKGKQKLYNYLLSKGYSYGTCSSVISELFKKGD